MYVLSLDLTFGAVSRIPLNPISVTMGRTFGRAAPRNDGKKWRSHQGKCVYTRVVMEAPTPAHCPSLRLLLLLLLPTGAWSQLWKGAEVQYILLEKQLAAMYPRAHCQKSSDQDNKHLSHQGITERLDPKAMEWCGTDIYCISCDWPFAFGIPRE